MKEKPFLHYWNSHTTTVDQEHNQEVENVWYLAFLCNRLRNNACRLVPSRLYRQAGLCITIFYDLVYSLRLKYETVQNY